MQNKGAEVSIAIPKAKKPVKYERASPGVYRGSNGELKRSASDPTKSPGLTWGMNPGERFLPGRPTRKPGLGTGAEMTIQPFPSPNGGKGSLQDAFDRMKQESAGATPTNPDALMKSIRDMLGGMGDGRDRRNAAPPANPLLSMDPGMPIPKQPMAPLIDYLEAPEGMQGILDRFNGNQIPRSNSISDILRRR